jgi:hypothetical protein
VLSDAETFAWGAVGAVVALLVVHVLPWAIALTKGADAHIAFWRVVGAVLMFAIFALGGGVVAMLVGDATEAKQAIAYGLGWQGLIGGFIQGTLGPGSR